MITDVVAEHRVVKIPGIAEVRQLTHTVLGLTPKQASTTGDMFPSRIWHMVESLSAIDQTRIEQAALDFARAVQTIPSVVAVSHAKDGNVYLVWTFVVQRDKSVRRQIYQAERQLMEKYPDLLFDFNVVALDQRDSGSLAPDDLQGRLAFYRDR